MAFRPNAKCETRCLEQTGTAKCKDIREREGETEKEGTWQVSNLVRYNVQWGE